MGRFVIRHEVRLIFRAFLTIQTVTTGILGFIYNSFTSIKAFVNFNRRINVYITNWKKCSAGHGKNYKKEPKQETEQN